MDDSRVTKLINKAKSSDADVKVDALAKLQAELEAGAEVPDAEAIISTLKACLKISHQHLTTAAVSVIPPLLPLIIASGQQHHRPTHQRSLSNSTSTSSTTTSIDAFNLRQALAAFLTPGGLFERLGDNREKPRDKARESLVLLGGYAFKAAGGSAFTSKSTSSKGPETPLATFERFMKDSGFGSKVWRIREQSILVLVQIRRSHPSFGLRSYLPSLVASLEDGDSNVRECAKQSLVELFTSPGVTDAARADLKKEMTKKGVRKATMDSVLSQVLSAPTSSLPSATSNELSQSGGKKEYVPPSLALMGKTPVTLPNGSGSTPGPSAVTRARTTSRGNTGPKVPSRPPSRAGVVSPTPTETSGGGGNSATGGTNLADIRNVYVASSRDLETEFAKMEKRFEGKETEHNWSSREQAINHVRGMIKGGDVLDRYYDTFMAHLKQFLDWSLKTLVSLRTTVAVNTCLLYAELVVTLETAFDYVCELVLTNLLRIAGFTKKLVAQQSQATVTTILKHTSAQPRMIPNLLWNTLQDKIVQARAYASGHVKTYIEIHASKARHAIETSGGLDTLVNSVKKALSDPNPGVRENARQAYWLLNAVWKDKGTSIMAGLDPTARKQLEKACPDSTLPANSPQTKKSSVAAVIAASRAKAKAIAQDPPTLRHQATSAARTTTSPKRPLSPSLSNSSVGSPPRNRPVLLTSHTRTATNTSTPSRSPQRDPLPSQRNASPPPPPSRSFDSVRRRTPTTSSAVSTSPGSPTFRRALSTALPGSPPSSSRQLPPALTPPKLEENIGPTRHSIANWSKMIEDDESLLMATAVPIPDDDSDLEGDDTSANPITFSSPFEIFPPMKTKSTSATPSFTTSSMDEPKLQMLHSMSSTSFSTHSPPATTPQPIAEDAMRARAEQAASAADRLMELVDQDIDDDSTVLIDLDDEKDPHPNNGSLLLPTSIVEKNGKPYGGETEIGGDSVRIAATLPLRTAKSQVPNITNIWGGKVQMEVPKTPATVRGSKENRDQRGAAIVQRAALLLDSPAATRRTGLVTDSEGMGAKQIGSVLDLLKEKKTGRDWWVKRMNLHRQSMAVNGTQLDHAEQFDELQRHIKTLETGSADVECLQKLAMFSTLYPVPETLSSLSQDSNFSIAGLPQWIIPKGNEFWAKEKSCDRLFDALRKFLDPSKEGALLEYGLIVLWELIENQTPYLEGKEADVFSLLLWIRYSGKPNVFEATFAIRDALTDRIEAVYGLTTMHGCLKSFASVSPPPDVEDGAGSKTMSYCFGLSALGKFIRRLPGEILEEELPRLKDTLISALTDSSSLLIRESAAAVIITAQLVLRDESQLFSLLDGLPDDKKNLLTYLFERHDARNIPPSTSGDTTIGGNADKGFEKLSKELSRLDRRMSTPRGRVP